jgi:hypothetical protein
VIGAAFIICAGVACCGCCACCGCVIGAALGTAGGFCDFRDLGGMILIVDFY